MLPSSRRLPASRAMDQGLLDSRQGLVNSPERGMHVAQVAKQHALHVPVAKAARQGQCVLVAHQRFVPATLTVLQVSHAVDGFAFQAAVAQVARQLNRLGDLGSGFVCSAHSVPAATLTGASPEPRSVRLRQPV